MGIQTQTLALKTEPERVEVQEICGVYLDEQDRTYEGQICMQSATIDVLIGRDGHGVHTRLCECHAAFFAGCLTEMFAELRRR